MLCEEECVFVRKEGEVTNCMAKKLKAENIDMWIEL
jgi:hypothetical protein